MDRERGLLVADQLRTRLSPDLAVRTVSRFKVSSQRGFFPVALIRAGRRYIRPPSRKPTKLRSWRVSVLRSGAPETSVMCKRPTNGRDRISRGSAASVDRASSEDCTEVLSPASPRRPPPPSCGHGACHPSKPRPTTYAISRHRTKRRSRGR